MCTISSWALEKAFLVASKGCLCFFSQQSPSVCCAILLVLSYAQERVLLAEKMQSLLPLQKSISPRIQQPGHGRELIYILLLSHYLKKRNRNMVSNCTADKQPRGHLFPCKLLLSPQYQERAHLYVQNWDNWWFKFNRVIVWRGFCCQAALMTSCPSICIQEIEGGCRLLVLNTLVLCCTCLSFLNFWGKIQN